MTLENALEELRQAHAVLDADASRIVRNTKDSYPESSEPRDLTLAERVRALCVYAADWKRWCEESEAKQREGVPAPTSMN